MSWRNTKLFERDPSGCTDIYRVSFSVERDGDLHAESGAFETLFVERETYDFHEIIIRAPAEIYAYFCGSRIARHSVIFHPSVRSRSTASATAWTPSLGHIRFLLTLFVRETKRRGSKSAAGNNGFRRFMRARAPARPSSRELYSTNQISARICL